MKKIHSVTRLFGFSIRKSLTPFFSFFGYEILIGETPESTGIAGFREMRKILKKCNLNQNLIDIGMGDGRLYKWIQNCNLNITYEGLDYGNSNDFKELKLPLKIHKQFFLEFKPEKNMT